jgi:hypothetical protein
MKKKPTIVFLLLIFLSGSLFAANSQQFVIATTLTGSRGTTLGIDFDGNFDFALNGNFGMTFASNWGFDAKVSFVNSSKNAIIRPAATYRLKVNEEKGMSFLFLLGPTLEIENNAAIWGVDLMAYFDIQIGKSFFARLGTGAQMRFEKNNFRGYVPIPEVALGFKF